MVRYHRPAGALEPVVGEDGMRGGGCRGAGSSRRSGSPGDGSGGKRPPSLAWILLLILAAATVAWTQERKQERKIEVPVGLQTKAGTLAPHPTCLGQCHIAHVVPQRLPLKAKTSALDTTQAAPQKGAPGAKVNVLDTICLACHQGPKVTADQGADKLPSSSGAISIHILDPSARRPVKFTRFVKNGKASVTLNYDCSGCHDVHGREPGPMLAPNAFDNQGQLLGSKPVYAAEVCFGCHAGLNAAPIQGRVVDIGKLFGRGIGSSHAIGQSATNRPDLLSLRFGRSKDRLDCVSCHGKSNPAGTPGPHASQYPRLLKADYASETEAFGSVQRAGELCYQCHDRTSIESDQSFPLHIEHISGFTRGASGSAPKTSLGPSPKLPTVITQRGARPGGGAGLVAGYGQPTPCATCHDPHGSLNNPSLIAFDPGVVTPSSVGGIAFQRLGLGHGSCTLTCHGYSHAQAQY